jgi:hypothetical protein
LEEIRGGRENSVFSWKTPLNSVFEDSGKCLMDDVEAVCFVKNVSPENQAIISRH